MVDFFKRYVSKHMEFKVPRASSSLAYYLIFSFFPLLIFLNSVLGLINLSITDIQNYLYFLPDNILAIVMDYNEYLTKGNNLTSFFVGLMLMLYSFTRCINSINYSVNEIFGVKNPKRSFIKSGFLTVSFMISVYLLLILTVLGDFIMNYLTVFFNFSVEFINLILFLRYFVSVSYFFLILFLVYKLLPNVKIKFTDCLPGTIFAMFGIFIASIVFSIYVVHFSNYSLIYGSLSTVMLLIMWLYCCSVIIIEGCIINKIVFEKRREKQILEDLK